MKYTVLGISSGLGVSLFPFKKHLIGNIEARGIFHTPKNEQWEANFPGVPLYKDSKAINEIKNSPDVMVSSPDCGSGSILRYSRSKELGDHNKNASLMAFFVALRKLKPKLFLFENLQGLFKSFPKERFIDLTNNYRLVIHNESVAHWGNSQKNRKRLVIIGIRRDLPKNLKKYFKLPPYQEPKTCKELYGDLAGWTNWEGYTCNMREDNYSVISIHARRKMDLKEIQIQWNTRLRGKKRWITEPGFKFSTAPGVYRNLSDSFPATARKANRQFDERGLTLTPRQLARVQGVPDSFKLWYDPNKSQYWINKGRTVVTKTPPMEISIWFKAKVEKALRACEKEI